MNRTIPVIILLFFSTLSFAQDDMAKASWVSSPVNIDGKALEWKLPLRYYDSGTKLFFAFANDDKNLYLCFQSPDEMNQVKIMRAGMEVSLSIKGKHKVSVTFPVGGQAAATSQNDNSGQEGQDRKTKRTSFILQNGLMEVRGFETKNGMIPINDSSGIHAAINWDDNDKLTYEAAIPLKEWLGTNFTAADISKDIAIEIEIKGVKRPVHPVAGGSDNGFSGRGRGGRSGGGGSHQRGESVDEDNSALPGENKWNIFEKSRLKEKFVLAQAGDSK